MNECPYCKDKGKNETVISVTAREGGCQELFVKAQDPKTALKLFRKVREIAGGKEKP